MTLHIEANLSGKRRGEYVQLRNFLIMQKSSIQSESVIGQRLIPVRHKVWRWKIFAQKDGRLLEAGQSVGSKAKAISVANSAARVWAGKTRP